MRPVGKPKKRRKDDVEEILQKNNMPFIQELRDDGMFWYCGGRNVSNIKGNDVNREGGGKESGKPPSGHLTDPNSDLPVSGSSDLVATELEVSCELTFSTKEATGLLYQ
uniref:Uncharacterized protein n=1 Tax=Timema poppense TaxID=170557 RepID=A0A7R9CP52_TIMPO|nr:unnamed protein product [Timema poppensis]